MVGLNTFKIHMTKETVRFLVEFIKLLSSANHDTAQVRTLLVYVAIHRQPQCTPQGSVLERDVTSHFQFVLRNHTDAPIRYCQARAGPLPRCAVTTRVGIGA